MGHDEHFEKTKFKSIHEIPDSWVVTKSKRDPDNKIYETRRYMNRKKAQILFSQNDGIRTYWRTPAGKALHTFTVAGSVIMLCVTVGQAYNVFSKK